MYQNSVNSHTRLRVKGFGDGVRNTGKTVSKHIAMFYYTTVDYRVRTCITYMRVALHPRELTATRSYGVNYQIKRTYVTS